MKKYYFKKNINIEKNVACIGYFDGVHRGHQQLLDKTLKLAREKHLKACVLTFDPFPHEVITKQKIKQLCSKEQKYQLFAKFGMDAVIEIHFDEALMKLSAEEFKTKILDVLNIDTLVCGYDFSYGYLGKGNPKTLQAQGLKVVIIPEYQYYGKKISSTRIREALSRGRIKFAEKMLGYELQ